MQLGAIYSEENDSKIGKVSRSGHAKSNEITLWN